MTGFLLKLLARKSGLQKTLTEHFKGTSLHEIVTSARDFPITSRVDVETSLDAVLSSRSGTRLFGIHAGMNHETPTMAHLLAAGGYLPIDVGPLQHDELDIGDADPVQCLKNGLWLSQTDSLPFAVLLGPSICFGQISGVHVEVAVAKGEEGAQLSKDLFRELEIRVSSGRTYRGRVLSLETQHNYSGAGGAVKVHRLQRVSRDDVVLPEKTLKLLDRNVSGFVTRRDQIKALKFSGKKGLLFYGPPGTGKTHTIHYLASSLPDHTTLLVTAEQVAFIGEYFRLARFLQPAMMIIEDVDLIARDREQIQHPGQESLLNKLLNEMDGLREDADVLTILTTNRPEQLEAALSSRPGRIDQAIEFPLPDDEGRRKLVTLYARNLRISGELMEHLVRRTEGVSGAFIKELMRRSAQFQIEAGLERELNASAVDAAMDEMVFLGGTLNVKLLGGAMGLVNTAEM